MRGAGPALGALHVRGDAGWFQADPGRPLLDPAAVALLSTGLGVVAAGALRRRDRGAILVPLALLVLLLPSAAAAAFPFENPSATRASGAAAPALLLAGAGLSRAIRSARAWGRPAALAAGGLLVLASGLDATARVSGWREAYERSAHAHRALAGEAAAFERGGAPFGNVFVVGLPHGVDDRAVAMEAGRVGRSPGLAPDERPLARSIAAAARDPRRPDFDATGPLLFLLAPRDEVGLAELRALFPDARVRWGTASGPEGGWVAVLAPAGSARRARVAVEGEVSAPATGPGPSRG